ncbi:hypothetical protein PRK78_002178 [Emydomyces testavorans]|uniref:Uncharacterized protein n=1 Tax=Emydomyces testavorans TaxID=2070801 RepID=A0AAF0IJE3_9EURO|nr:hypothetical protein PRK78_002178 [Emydomyces testavorans]
MPRRSSRFVPDSSAKLQSSPTNSSSLNAQRRAKRQRSREDLLQENRKLKSSTKKSRYFEQPDAESSNDELSAAPSEVASSPRSAYADSNAESYAPDTNDEDEEEPVSNYDDESEDYNPKGGGTARKASGKSKGRTRSQGKEPRMTQAPRNKELWREGVKAGLGPGKEVFIELPNARDPGNTPYEDHTIHPNTMLFLKDLKANNNREWLKRHDQDYRTSKKDWDTFVEKLSEKIMEKDSTIPELPVKDLVCREAGLLEPHSL